MTIAYSGICGSDVHAYLGHDARRPAPLVLGHEAAGTLADGRRVVINPLITCGACEACRRGRENLCTTRQIISMPPRDGALPEAVAVPVRNLHAVPDGMTLEKAALTEPLACGWHAVNVAIRHGDRALAELADAERPVILGGGAIGLGVALCLVAHGAPGAVIVEPNLARWPHIEAAGPFVPVRPDDAPQDVPLVFDAYGGGRSWASASRLVRAGGTIVHIGLADEDPGLDVRRTTLAEIAFVGVYTYMDEEFAQTLAAMADGRLGRLDWPRSVRSRTARRLSPASSRDKSSGRS